MALITPEKLAASGTEDGTQRAYLQYCRTQLQPHFPEVMTMFHVPNGGQRGSELDAKITMAKLKSMGLVPGVPDIVLPLARCGYNALMIEFKKPDGSGRLHDDQVKYIEDARAADILVAVLDRWSEASAVTLHYLNRDKKALMEWMIPTPGEGLLKTSGFIDPRGYLEKHHAEKLRPKRSRRR